MERTEWSVTSEYMGWTKQEFLFTYNESEREENEVNKNNAWLIYEADFYPLYTDFLKLDINATELIIISYLYYWTKRGKWIYTKNEDLAALTKTSVPTITRTLKNLVDKWYISVVEKKLKIWTDRKMQVTPPLIKLISAGHQNDESYNNKKNKNDISAPLGSGTLSTNTNLNKKNSITLQKTSELDIIKNSDDIREVLSDEEIRQYKMQLKIILKMVELWYKVPKTKQDIEKEIERLKSKAKLYWLIQWDGNIAWTTFYQKIDKRFDWHTEKWKPVKNFKTSIIPFISK